MPNIFRSSQAETDLVEIAFYIARDNPSADHHWLEDIEKKIELLAANPEIGSIRPELAERMRSLSAGNYVIYFRAVEDGIEVVRVLHGSRDVDAGHFRKRQ